MSDTPRTDAASVSREYIEREMDRYTQKFVLADHMSDLERELAEAKAEVVRLKGEAESWEKVFDRTCEHLADAKTELAKARKDAERYRWLRDDERGRSLSVSSLEWKNNAELCDAAIDAAMKEGGK